MEMHVVREWGLRVKKEKANELKHILFDRKLKLGRKGPCAVEEGHVTFKLNHMGVQMVKELEKGKAEDEIGQMIAAGDVTISKEEEEKPVQEEPKKRKKVEVKVSDG